jgi:hypothetical protein
MSEALETELWSLGPKDGNSRSRSGWPNLVLANLLTLLSKPFQRAPSTASHCSLVMTVSVLLLIDSGADEDGRDTSDMGSRLH